MTYLLLIQCWLLYLKVFSTKCCPMACQFYQTPTAWDVNSTKWIFTERGFCQTPTLGTSVLPAPPTPNPCDVNSTKRRLTECRFYQRQPMERHFYQTLTHGTSILLNAGPWKTYGKFYQIPTHFTVCHTKTMNRRHQEGQHVLYCNYVIPARTGQAACSICMSLWPDRWMLCQKTADPFSGLE